MSNRLYIMDQLSLASRFARAVVVELARAPALEIAVVLEVVAVAEAALEAAVIQLDAAIVGTAHCHGHAGESKLRPLFWPPERIPYLLGLQGGVDDLSNVSNVSLPSWNGTGNIPLYHMISACVGDMSSSWQEAHNDINLHSPNEGSWGSPPPMNGFASMAGGYATHDPTSGGFDVAGKRAADITPMRSSLLLLGGYHLCDL